MLKIIIRSSSLRWIHFTVCVYTLSLGKRSTRRHCGLFQSHKLFSAHDSVDSFEAWWRLCFSGYYLCDEGRVERTCRAVYLHHKARYTVRSSRSSLYLFSWVWSTFAQELIIFNFLFIIDNHCWVWFFKDKSELIIGKRKIQ